MSHPMSGQTGKGHDCDVPSLGKAKNQADKVFKGKEIIHPMAYQITNEGYDCDVPSLGKTNLEPR